MSYFKLLTELKSILELDSRIKTITSDDVDDIDGYKQNIYSLAHIIIEDSNPTDNLSTYSVLVQCVDIVMENNNITTDKFKGNSNIQEVYNDMDNVINRMYGALSRRASGTNINVISKSPHTKILESQTDNRLAGWAASFQVEVPNLLMDVCEIV